MFGKESPIVLKRDKKQQLRNNCELKGLCDRHLGNIWYNAIVMSAIKQLEVAMVHKRSLSERFFI